VVISYDELGVLPAQVGKQGEMTRWEEHPKVELVEAGDAETEDVQIRLGRVVVSQVGQVVSFDASVRQIAGPRLNAGVVTGAALADGAVTTNKIASNAVTGAKIADATINEVKLDAATRAKLGGGLSSGGVVNGSLGVLGDLQVQGSIGGFGLDQMFATTLTFTSANGDGTLNTVPIDFTPRLILLTGGISGRFEPNGNDNRFGSAISGFAFSVTTLGTGPDTSLRQAVAAAPEAIQFPGPTQTITQLCHGPNIVRSAAGLVRQDVGSFAAIAGGSFLNNSPVQGTNIQLTVTSMVQGNVTFRLSRTLRSPATTLLDVEGFSFNVIILGYRPNNLF